MTAYATIADMVSRFGKTELAQLTDLTAGQTPVDAVVTAALDEASALIDSYVSAKYVTPLSPVPAIVRVWCGTIARRILWRDRATKDGPVMLAYDDALSQIKDVARNIASLPDATGVQPASSGGLIVVQASDPVFTDDLLATMPG